MALQSPTQQQSSNSGGVWRTVLDPTVVAWVHPLLVITLIFAQVAAQMNGAGRIAQPVLVGMGGLVVLLTSLQLWLHSSDPKAYKSPHLVQPLVTLLLIMALALLKDPLTLPTLVGVLAFQVWLDVVAELKRFIPTATRQPLRWALPVLATILLMVSIRIQEPMGVVLVGFMLPLWLTVLPDPPTWDV